MTSFADDPIDEADQSAVIAKLQSKILKDLVFYTNRLCFLFLIQTPLLIFAPKAMHKSVGAGVPIVSRILSLLCFFSILLTCIDLKYDPKDLQSTFESLLETSRRLSSVRSMLSRNSGYIFNKYCINGTNVLMMALVCLSNWRFYQLESGSALAAWVRSYYMLCVVDFVIGLFVKRWFGGLMSDVGELEKLKYHFKSV
ncbi:hypothetical protein BABINDRAFT_183642 [Babjeviella inositovora NRRL Y-12698]|uniref:Uncharacterized protein n=1 Tax=Babjeviella inositovora NRRL Y-12698 TaxID=984486 RepID=A0A1E3QQC5_9ASCO|nr:uncharacterized protein BABINDRAFT_183642 [Babjeviella inositovora NRRL Y-12698]ODQ79167.1 hypothetical protein BABINDRAFT_183642 [Babjeviella inositovora NRRL Y-12698]